MKDLCQYGNRPEDEWEILPWIPDPRPPFKIWVKPEQIAPFFLIPHHPYAISLLLKISDGFRTEEFFHAVIIPHDPVFHNITYFVADTDACNFICNDDAIEWFAV